MMRRFASLWLPTWPADRWRRATDAQEPRPLALAAAGAGGLRLVAVDRLAALEGISPGMTLASARALVSDLDVAEADPVADQAGLDALALWARRYTPWSAVDGADGLMLEITGAAHLLGGAASLAEDAVRRLEKAGITAQAGVAGTPAAAWAWARHRADAPAVLGDEGLLAKLPVRALRISSAAAEGLERLGLKTIGALADVPRASLTLRWGEEVLRRLDRMFGRLAEPISPRAEAADHSVRRGFPEPLLRREDLEAVAAELLERLCRGLEAASLGAREVELVFIRVDASALRAAAGTSALTRDPGHLLRLFRERWEGIDPGFGVEAMTARALQVEPWAAAQGDLGGRLATEAASVLVDRLRARAGGRSVLELRREETHVPERASRARPAGRPGSNLSRANGSARPLTLFGRPEPIDPAPEEDGDRAFAAGELPRFRWRGRIHDVVRMEGPERIKPEWWRESDEGAAPRDYWRVETAEGRRYWIFRQERAAGPAAWRIHGLFA